MTRISTYLSPADPFSNIIASLNDVQMSASITVLSDSTGAYVNAGNPRWPRLLATSIGAICPNARVQLNDFSDSNTDYTSETVIQAGASGERYINFTGIRGRFQPAADVGDWTNDLDIRVKASMTSWVPVGIGQALMARYTSAPLRSFSMYIDTAGKLNLAISSDGTAIVNVISTAALGFAASSVNWLRATYVKSSGIVTLYTSTDGVTFSSIGSSSTGNTGGIYKAPSQPYEIGSSNGSTGAGTGSPFSGKIYAAEIRDGINGKVMNASPIESWEESTSDGTSLGGSPTLYFWTGAIPGATQAYLSDSTRMPMLLRNTQPGLVLLSCSHNDLASSFGSQLYTPWDSWLAAMKSRAPGASFCLVTQNPNTSPANFIEAQAKRSRSQSAWALRNGLPVIDVFRAFMRSTTPIASLVDPADGVHPLAAGSTLWANTVFAPFNTRAVY